MDTNGYSTWLEIDLGAVQNNVHQLQQITGCEVMTVVKANGYGHGAIPIAQAAVKAGSSWCGVGRLEEALALRQAGLDCEILVLGYTPPAGILEAISQNISVTVYDQELGEEYAQLAQHAHKCLRTHVKIDTGMGRLGVMSQSALEFIRWLSRLKGLQIEGIFTHFARADEPQASLTTQQIERFSGVLDQLRSESLCPPIIHAANSAAAIYFHGAYFNMVRAGIAVYGLHPSSEALLPPGFLPALTWKARLTSLKTFPPGHGISYGSIYTTEKAERIGTIPVGYADGFRRVLQQQVLLHEQRASVVGRVCMDQCALQLDEIPQARIGDEVVLLGQQGTERISAEELGKRWGTVNYEVVCGLANRLPRLYY